MKRIADMIYLLNDLCFVLFTVDMDDSIEYKDD